MGSIGCRVCTMDVKTVCLGILTEGPASGYDLKKQFESTFGHFFAAGYGSIYPALSSLAEQGLVSCEEIPQEGKPDRKVYEITPAGLDYLRDALRDPCPCHKVRSEFLATMCFAHLMPREDVETILDNRLEDIARYQAMFREFEAGCASDWPEGKKFVLGFGKAIARAMETYISENRHLLVSPSTAKAANG
jgi:DNA-binding PadR family transcriptional regulator